MLLLNASGCLDALTAPEVARSLDAFVTKTVTPEPREGNPPVRIAETDAGMLNSIGLANPGRERVPRPNAAAFGQCARTSRSGCRSVASLRASTRRRAEQLGRDEVAAIELNLSCPNVDEAPESAAEIVAACRAATSLPLYAKLSPAAWDIAEVARAVEAAGADGLSLVNTIRGLALDRAPAPASRPGRRRLLGPRAQADRARGRLRLPARDRASDRRDGRGLDGTRRARVDRRRSDPRRPSERSSSPTRKPPRRVRSELSLAARKCRI